jgi:hypothetical protein
MVAKGARQLLGLDDSMAFLHGRWHRILDALLKL